MRETQNVVNSWRRLLFHIALHISHILALILPYMILWYSYRIECDARFECEREKHRTSFVTSVAVITTLSTVEKINGSERQLKFDNAADSTLVKNRQPYRVIE